MNLQTLKTHCLGCGKELKCKTADLTEDNEINVDFIRVKFECDCGTTTCVSVDFHENNYRFGGKITRKVLEGEE